MIRPSKRQLTIGLYTLGFLLYGVVFFLGLNQLTQTRRVAANTAELVNNTNQLIKSQGEVLDAIKGVTNDTKITAEQQTTIIICMLQVPVSQRTTNLQQECRDSALVTESTSTSSNSSRSAQDSSGRSGQPNNSSSSSNPTPNTAPPQSPQQPPMTIPTPNCKVDILFIHLAC